MTNLLQLDLQDVRTFLARWEWPGALLDSSGTVLIENESFRREFPESVFGPDSLTLPPGDRAGHLIPLTDMSSSSSCFLYLEGPCPAEPEKKPVPTPTEIWPPPGYEFTQTEKEAFFDSLTGLANRNGLARYWSSLAVQREKRFQEGTLLFCDLDGFKTMNDHFGHLAGDECLRIFGTILSTAFRTGDLPVRYGGDEFLILLPGCPTSVARTRMAELQNQLTNTLTRRFPESTPIHISYGAATFRAGHPLETALAPADQACYRAKQQKDRPE